MKKSLSLLTIGFVALSSVAQMPVGQQFDKSNFILNENAKQLCIELQKEAQAKADNGDDDVYTRSVTQGGYTYSMQITPSTQYTWGDFYNKYTNPEKTELAPITLEDWPFHIAMLQVSSDGDEYTYWYVLSWPTNLMYKQVFGKDENYDPENKETWDYSRADMLEMFNNNDDLIHTFKQVDYGTVGYLPYTWNDDDEAETPVYWSMVGINQLFTNTVVYKGKRAIMHVPTNENEQAIVDFISMDKTDFILKAYLKFFSETTADKVVHTTTFNWESSILGFGPYNTVCDFPEIKELHVFKDKVQTIDNLSDLGYDNDDMTELYRYYIAGYGEKVTLGYQLGKDNSFESSRIAYSKRDSNITDDDVNYFLGALYLPANAAEFENDKVFNMEAITYTDEIFKGQVVHSVNMYPHEYSVIPSAIDFQPCRVGNDGLTLVYKTYYTPLLSPTTLRFGTVNGFEMSAFDYRSTTWKINYQGKINYHNNPKDITEYKQIDAIGSQESSVESILGNPNKLNVRVENDSIVAPEGSEIYDMSGCRVAGNGCGIYIVRKDDKAVKVLVK